MNLLPVGPILDKSGPTVVSLIAVIFTVFPHVGLAMLPLHKPFIHEEFIVYALFMFGGKVLSISLVFKITFIFGISKTFMAIFHSTEALINLSEFMGNRSLLNLYHLKNGSICKPVTNICN